MTVIHTEPIDMPDFGTMEITVDNVVNLSLVVNQAIARGRKAVQRTTHSWPYGKYLSHRTVEEQKIVEFFWKDIPVKPK